VRDDSRSEIGELEDVTAMEKGKDSLLAIEAVKLENRRCDLPSVLRDEVEMATGRMSVGGQSSSTHAANYNNTDSVF
jgi:ferric-chelate reductase